MMIVAKMSGRIVQVMRVADTVAFSSERGWVMICTDFEQPDHKQQGFKWVPATTRFEWVGEFCFGEDK